MIAFKILMVVFVLGGLVLANLRSFNEGKIRVVRLAASVLALLIVLLMLPAIGQVSAGHRGVVLRFGGITGRVLDEGFYVVTPFVESVQAMDVQVHAHKTKASAASRDLQDVQTEITLNFALDTENVATVYRTLREDYEERIIGPAVQEAIKSATAEYNAEQLIQERVKVRAEIDNALRTRLGAHHILVDQVSITDFKFAPEFEKAIEAKVVAVQSALRAENMLRQIKTEAEQRIATATAEATAIKIQAEAIRSQGGAEYVNLKAVEKWNGILPTWMSGGAVPFVNIPARATP